MTEPCRCRWYNDWGVCIMHSTPEVCGGPQNEYRPYPFTETEREVETERMARNAVRRAAYRKKARENEELY